MAMHSRARIHTAPPVRAPLSRSPIREWPLPSLKRTVGLLRQREHAQIARVGALTALPLEPEHLLVALTYARVAPFYEAPRRAEDELISRRIVPIRENGGAERRGADPHPWS